MANNFPDNLRFLTEQVRHLQEEDQHRSFDGGGGGGYDHPMEERVKKLEDLVSKTVERVVNIERDVAVIRSNYASKEDLHKELHATTWKIVGAIALLCGAVFWMARNIEPPHSTPASSATSAAPVAQSAPVQAPPAKH